MIFYLRRYFSVPKLVVGTTYQQKVIYTHETNDAYNSMFNCQPSKQVNSMLLSSIFSGVIGSNIHKSIYLKQTIDKIGSVDVGGQIDCEVSIVEDLGKNRYRLETKALHKN